jgi:serine/threonine protein kinase
MSMIHLQLPRDSGMPLPKEPNAEPIPGYRLIKLLGRGGCGEVWKCEVPGGLFKAIKFVHGNHHALEQDHTAADEELRAIQQIKTIRHPFLLALDRVEHIQGELVMVTELADRSLHELLEEHRRRGESGLPRAQLLNYLREAAEVLDLLHFEHGLQHLDIKPRNLFLVANHIKVADFGLVSSLAADSDTGTPLQLGAITPLYAAPEIYHGQISRHSDQYSLAVSYQELLTGRLPFEGRNSRQLLLLHTGSEPNLQMLPGADQPIIARALAKDPTQRYASCSAFVQELVAADPPRVILDAAVQPGMIADKSPVPRSLQPEKSDADTDRNLKGLTERQRPQPRRGSTRFDRDILPAGYDLGKCLDKTPLLERWQIEATDGRKHVLRILYGSHALETERLEQALLRFETLGHPGLMRLEVRPSTTRRVVLVSELLVNSLRDYLLRCQNRKLRGIPRNDLVSFLLTAAETLDYLYRQHSIQHLCLSPRNLLLDQGRVVIDEFGIGQLLWRPAGLLPAQPNRRYAAPELAHGRVSTSCDQYSLALIFAELLTGQLPGDGQRDRGAALPLDGLCGEDAAIVARATDPDPSRRWPSCLDFLHALENRPPTPSLSEQADHDEFTALIRNGSSNACAIQSDVATFAPALKRLIAHLRRSASGEVTMTSKEEPPELSACGQLLTHQFSATVPLGDARRKLDAVRQQVFGQLIHDDGEPFCFHLSLPSNFWRMWIGRQPGLQVQVSLARQHVLAPTPIDVAVAVHAFRCSRKRGRELLQQMGLAVLEQLRAALLVNSEKRIQERLLWPHQFDIWPLLPDGSRDAAVFCRGKDISLSGIGFYLPHQLETSQVVINLPATVHTEALSIPATLVRARHCADGWYEVGALFRPSVVQKSHRELSAAKREHCQVPQSAGRRQR